MKKTLNLGVHKLPVIFVFWKFNNKLLKKVLLTGASGMIGKIILRECLNREDIETVTSIVRRAMIKAALYTTDKMILENEDIKQI